jgi:hypothetical protein
MEIRLQNTSSNNNYTLHFSGQDLLKLKEAEGKKLTGVIYHNWINKSNPNELFEFLEKLELRFDRGSLVITVPETEEDGLQVAHDFDAEKQRLLLLHEFNGKIDIRSDEMSNNVLWENAINKTLHSIRLVHENGTEFSNASILLDFGDEQLEIRPGMDGVIVEPYDEV